MRIATHVLLFGQDKWILRNLENAYPHVDIIYVSYSKKPWTYNPNARNLYNNTANIQELSKSKWWDKVHLITGEWETEEQQRNACVNCALRDGIDYLIIHDADEFYLHREFQRVIQYIKDNPDYDYYKVGWYCFWKSFKNLLMGPNGSGIIGYPEFAINLNRGIYFQSKRRPIGSNVNIIPTDVATCYHGSYVLTDEELLTKINTWGHTNDFDKHYWFNEKWLKWTPDMKDLHLVTPSDWKYAAEINMILPEVISDMV
jgi:hypothetical protein